MKTAGEQQRKKSIIASMYGTHTPGEIASELKINVGTVYNYASEEGITDQKGIVSYEEKIAALRMRLDGLSYPKIAARMGYAESTVRHLCHRVGLTWRIDQWPERKLFEEARKYNSYRDLQIEKPAAYQAARKKGLLDKIRGVYDEIPSET